ncbi:MAG: tetratricopeptide repeat protein [Planctomycetes bacterium]|nr:tetratricopeptide repeat protein [Planctomycetota bacterium]
MAKRKFNLKFFLLFSSVAVLVAILIGGFYYYQIVLGPERNFRNGNQYMESGNYDKAINYYGRSISKKPNNITYLNAMEAALLKLVPKTSSEASERYNSWVNVRMARTRAASADPKVWIDAMETLRDRCELYNSDVMWRDFSVAGELMSRSIPAEDPAQALAKFWKVLGLNARFATLTPEERDQLDKGFPEVVKLLPTNDRVWLAYLDYLLVKADTYERGNQKALAEETFRKFDAAVVECRKVNPGGIAAPASIVTRLEDLKAKRTGQVKQEDLDAAFKEVLEVAPRIRNDRKLTLAAAGAIFSARSFDANVQAMKLIEERLKEYPNDAVTQRVYLNIARGMSTGIGKDIAEAVFVQPNLPTSIESVSQLGAREAAGDLLYTLAFEDWRKATDEADKKAKLEIVRQTRDRVVKYFTSQSLTAQVEDIEARTALAEGNANDAAIRFDALLKKIPDPTQEMYFYAGYANILRNQPGTALSLVTRGLEHFPTYPPLLNLSAKLNGGMGRYDEARKALEKLVEVSPDDKEARESLALLGDAKKTNTEVAATRATNAVTAALGAAEREMMKHNFDGAIAMLAKELAANPSEVRILQALCQVNIVKGDLPAAKVFIDKGLALDPKNTYFLQMRAITDNTDPIDRIVASIKLLNTDPKEQKVQIYVGLSSAMYKMRQAVTNIPEDKLDPAVKAQMERCEKMMGPALDEALAADPKNLLVLEIASGDAQDRKDFAAVEKYAAAVADAGDLGLAATIRSRVLVSQDKLQEAIAVIQAARQKGDQNPIMLRQLGMLFERTGNVEGALELVRESYDRRPNDATTARVYAELLQRSGDRQKSLQVLQQAARVNPDDNELIVAWLDLEGQIGDRTGTFLLRKRIYKERPSFGQNSLALARLLLETPGDPNLMVDANNKQKFTEQDLRDANTPRMQAALAAAAKANLEEGFEIIRFLQEAAPGDTTLSLINARALKKFASEKEGEAAIRRDIAKVGPGKSAELWIALGVYLDENKKPEAARVAFEEAQKQQDPKTMGVNIRIADYWFNQSQWKNAREALETAAKAGAINDAGLWMRLSEICSRLRDYDAAEQYLAKAASGSPTKETLCTIELLRATNLQGRGELAIINGDVATSDKDFNSAREALTRATELLPNSSLAWVSLSDFERKMYQRTRDPKRIQAAEQAADRATDISVGYWQGIRNKEMVLLEQDKVKDAITVVDKFLSLASQNTEARRDLIELHLRANNVQRAIDLAQEGSRMNPRDATWQTLVGNLNVRRNDMAGATTAFDAAFTIQPGENQLFDCVNQRLRSSKDKKDWAGVLTLLRNNAIVVATSPKLQILLAVALVNTNQRDPGLTAMRTGYKTIQDGIATGAMRSDEWGMWYSGLGNCFEKKPQESEVFVKSLLGKKEMDYWNCTGIATLYADLGPEGTSRAVELLEQAAALAKAQGGAESNQLQAVAYMQAGNLLYADKNCEKGVQYFEKALALIPTNPSALNNASYLIAKCGSDFPRAIELARKCVELNPGVDDFQDTLGFALLKAGKAQESLEPFQKAYVMTQKPGSMIHLAEAFIELKRPADAREFLEKAKTRTPTDDQLAEIKALEAKLK